MNIKVEMYKAHTNFIEISGKFNYENTNDDHPYGTLLRFGMVCEIIPPRSMLTLHHIWIDAKTKYPVEYIESKSIATMVDTSKQMILSTSDLGDSKQNIFGHTDFDRYTGDPDDPNTDDRVVRAMVTPESINDLLAEFEARLNEMYEETYEGGPLLK